MKKTTLIIIIIFFNHLSSISQGFDWQYSLRLPYDSPNTFISFSSEFGISNHTGSFNFIENNITCCNFSDGNGFNYNINTFIEHWYNGKIAFYGGIGYKNLNGLFSKRQEIPRSDNYFLVTEYQYKNSISQIPLEFGSKYRISETHFFISGSLILNLLISESHNFKEIKISPISDPFRDREIPTAKLKDLNIFFIGGRISLGYDYSIGKGKYLSIIFSYSRNINSFIKSESWYSNDYSLIIKLNRDILFR